jgi:para-aminobenzoate synthetase component 1
MADAAVAQTSGGLAWRDPVEVAASLAARPWSAAFLSDGGPNGRWSYVAADPDRVEVLGPDDRRDGLALLRDMLGPRRPPASGAPFRGGVVGLAAYEFGARIEPVDLERDPDWPDLALARYRTVLVFDHHRRRLEVHGDAEAAGDWLATSPPPPHPARLADSFAADAPHGAYETAVAQVIARIEAGEIFQANIARSWSGRLRAGAHPFELVRRLAGASPAPFAAWWGAPGRALVSNSPERFVSLAPRRDGGFEVQTRPIKGTRPRGRTAAEDAALAAELSASEKDRAENLMIVDLMRNDLARVCRPGAVLTPELFRAETYANVHHLVSTVTGRLAPGRDAADLLGAAFPPGSITGAPKVQAMKVIAEQETGLGRFRGPWCGSLFWAGFDGAFDSSVLIRSAALVEDAQGWRFRALAGAGIVAESDPVSELHETEAKMAALERALTEPA